MRWVVLVALVMMLMPSSVAAQGTPVATPEASPVIIPHVSCYGWEVYAKAMREARLPFSEEEYQAVDAIAGVPFGDYATIRSDHLLLAASYFDKYAGRAELIENIPPALASIHQDYVDRLVLISRYMTVNADANVLSIAFYRNKIDESSDAIIDDVAGLSQLCGDQWIRFASSNSNPYLFMWDQWYVPIDR